MPGAAGAGNEAGAGGPRGFGGGGLVAAVAGLAVAGAVSGRPGRTRWVRRQGSRRSRRFSAARARSSATGEDALSRSMGRLLTRLQNSAVNAKPFSLNGVDIPQASYAQSRFSLIFGGPLVIPKLVKDPKTQFFFTYFGTRAKNPDLFTETVPTAAERSGDFSQATQSLGTAAATNVPVTIYQPGTNTPFPGNRIPSSLLNPIALGLLNFYPLPNQVGGANNYQFETVNATNSNNLGIRVQRSITNKDRLSVNFQYQNRSGTTAQWFGGSDQTHGYGLNAQVGWTRNLTARAISNAQIRFNRNYTQINPLFLVWFGRCYGVGDSRRVDEPAELWTPNTHVYKFCLAKRLYCFAGAQPVSIGNGKRHATKRNAQRYNRGELHPG